MRKVLQTVEQHFDDCGEDFSMLEGADPSIPGVFPSEWEHSLEGLDTLVSWRFGLNGSDFSPESDSELHPFGGVGQAWSYPDMASFTAEWLSNGEGHHDVAELCGGAGDTAKLLVRRGFRAGPNFDIVCGIDLLQDSEVNALDKYLRSCQPFIVLISTPCTSLKGFSALNRVINPEGWARSRKMSLALGRLGARVATTQMRAGRHFLAENPRGSDMWSLPEWRALAEMVDWIYVDQCMCNLRGPRTGMLIKKPTEFWASHAALLDPLRGRLCDGAHQHGQVGKGSSKVEEKAKNLARWPVKLCRLIAEGCTHMLRNEAARDAYVVNAFPSNPGGAASSSAGPAAPLGVTCPGCLANKNMFDVSHTYVPSECREADGFSCPACRQRLSPFHKTHTMVEGQCRARIMQLQAGAAKERQGAHPRSPRVPAAASTTTTMRPAPPAPDDFEEDEADAMAAERARPLRVRAPRVDTRVRPQRQALRRPAAAARAAAELGAQRGDDSDRQPDPVLDGAPSASGDPAAPAADPVRQALDRSRDAPAPAEGEAQAAAANPKRSRAAGVDAETQASPDLAEWGQFDMGRAMNLLHSRDANVVRRTIRRLHIRFWHASAARLEELLRHAGAPVSVIAHIKEIVNTCRICRMWTKPRPKAVATTRLSTAFNEIVQWDILFHRKIMVSHLIDEAIRWTTAAVLTDKEAVTLLTTITVQWLQPYGAMQVLVTDREAGLVSEEVAQWLGRWSVQLKPKAPGGHAQIVERHHAILRATL